MAQSKIKQKLNTLFSRIYTWQSIACKTLHTYTGLYVTVPAHSVAVISVRAAYNNSKPITVSINSDNSNANNQLASGGYDGVTAACTYCFATTDQELTRYIWATYASAANNNFEVTGAIFQIGGGNKRVTTPGKTLRCAA